MKEDYRPKGADMVLFTIAPIIMIIVIIISIAVIPWGGSSARRLLIVGAVHISQALVPIAQIAGYLRFVQNLGLTEDETELILWRNTARIFDLDPASFACQVPSGEGDDAPAGK